MIGLLIDGEGELLSLETTATSYSLDTSTLAEGSACTLMLVDSYTIDGVEYHVATDLDFTVVAAPEESDDPESPLPEPQKTHQTHRHSHQTSQGSSHHCK